MFTKHRDWCCTVTSTAVAAFQEHVIFNTRRQGISNAWGNHTAQKESIMSSGSKKKVGKKGLDGTVKNLECFVRTENLIPIRSEKPSKVSEQGSKIMKAEF